jgi:hypothetical protein
MHASFLYRPGCIDVNYPHLVLASRYQVIMLLVSGFSIFQGSD